MFSPSLNNGAANAPTTPMTTRGRRRQRPLNSDSTIQQPKKKQRLPLSEEVSTNPSTNPNPNPDSYEVKSAKPTTVEAKRDGIEYSVPQTLPKQELSVRSKKPRHADRLNKGDGSTLLVCH